MKLRSVLERILPATVTAGDDDQVRAVVREAALVQAQARQWALEVELYRRARTKAQAKGNGAA